MTADIAEEGLLACELCLKEVPASERASDEAVDYVLHYFGTDCYRLWSSDDRPASDTAG